MSIQAAQLVAEVSVQGDSEAKSKLNSVSETVGKVGSGFKSMLGNALSFAAGGLIDQGLGFLKDQISGVFTESMNAQAGMALTNAVLKSTHDASGETAQSIADLATQYSHLTKFSDDTVQSGENMLLTFTNIGKDVFPQATKTVLDMSQALGQDTKSSAIQLGKALNDPITGISALQRVGVTFNQTQKDLIKGYMQHGDTAKAQSVILQELQKEFGGSAVAAGKTFGGQLAIAGQYMDDFKQNLGDDLMPIVTNFLGVVEKDGMPILQKFSDWFTKDGLTGLENFVGGIVDTVNNSGALQSVLKTINDILPDLKNLLGNLADKLTNDLLPPVLNLVKNFSDWIDSSGLLTDAIGLLNWGINTLSGLLGPVIQDLANMFGWLSKNKPVTDGLKDAVIVLGGAFVALKIANTVSGFQQMFSKISEGEGLVSGLGKAFKEKLSGAVSDFLSNHAPNLKTALDDIKSKSKAAGDEVETMGTKTSVTSGEVTGLGTASDVAAGEETVMGDDASVAGGKISAMGGEAGVASGELAGAGAAGAGGGLLGALAGVAGAIAGVGAVALGLFGIAQLLKSMGLPDAPNAHNNSGPDWITHHNAHPHASGILNNPIGHWGLVGEQGPELMYVPQGASIFPNSQSMQMTQGGNDSNAGRPVVLMLDGFMVGRGVLPHIASALQYGVNSRVT